MPMRPPNIVCVVLDHVTFRHYMTLRGAKPLLPAYEKLASEGVAFVNARSAHPLCLPARATMLTGVYTHKHKRRLNWPEDFPEQPYRPYSHFLREAGYDLGYFGKNHSGFDLKEHGFEGYFPPGYGNPYLTPEYRDYLRRNGLPNPVYRQEWGIGDHCGGRYDLSAIDAFNFISAGVLESGAATHETAFLASLAADWIRSRGSSPYMVRLDTWGPHHSYHVPAEWAGLLRAEDIPPHPSFRDRMAHRPAFVQNYLERARQGNPASKSWEDFRHISKRIYEHYAFVDHAVGQFIDRLPDRENTVVILTADHGDSAGCHGGMLDKAGDMMEELMHIPLVIRLPGGLKGRPSALLASNLDLAPTLLDAAGLEIPGYMDGQSLLPAARGQAASWREDLMAEHYGHFNDHFTQRALYRGDWKYIVTQGGPNELYNLAADPFELNNRVDDPAAARVLAEMRERLSDRMRRHGDDAASAPGFC